MGASASALPDTITIDVAKEFSGDKFDQTAWDGLTIGEDGTVSKAAFIALLEGSAGGGVTREDAEAEAKADA